MMSLPPVHILGREGTFAIGLADGRIASIRPAEPGGRRLLAMPALANAHDHARPLSPTSFGGADKPLETWILRLGAMPPADPYLASVASLGRAAMGGCASVMAHVTRLHGPFVSDGEVEAVAGFLRAQGQPQYLEAVTAIDDEEGFEGEGGGSGGDGEGDLYDQAVAVVTRDRKASTSYIQRRLQIGYNRAASLMERMEQQGVVGAANHAGKREILAGPPPLP